MSKKTNDAFADELMQVIPRNGYSELFVDLITDSYNNQTRSVRVERKELIREINSNTKRMENARELLLNNDIDAADYRIIKEQCNEKITRLEAKLNDLKSQNDVILASDR